MTPVQRRDFQSVHLDHLGRPLVVSGVSTPETEWALDFATLCAARRAIVHTAQEHLGLTEAPIGSNSDRAGFIRRWLMLCGAQPGEPWCAAYASHCIGTVSIAGAQALGRHFPATLHPLAGDVMWFETGPVHGHCGIVLGASAAEVMTIEGNCNNAVRCVRRPRPGLHFAQTIGDTSGTSPGVVPSVPLAPGATH